VHVGVLSSGENIPKGSPLLISLDAALARFHLAFPVTKSSILIPSIVSNHVSRILNRKALDTLLQQHMDAGGHFKVESTLKPLLLDIRDVTVSMVESSACSIPRGMAKDTFRGRLIE